MSIKEAYYKLGNNKYLKTMLGASALGGAAGSIYGLNYKDNNYHDPLHPATSAYASLGLKAGAGLGAGALASRLLGMGSLGRILTPMGGAGLGLLAGLSSATRHGKPDLRLKQPGIDYSYDPAAESLKYLTQEANKL
jgi:hypothetical protein